MFNLRNRVLTRCNHALAEIRLTTSQCMIVQGCWIKQSSCIEITAQSTIVGVRRFFCHHIAQVGKRFSAIQKKLQP